MKDWRKDISDRANCEGNAGMSLGGSMRNLGGDIKWVVGYINLKLKGKGTRDEDLRVTALDGI